ncbi:MAG: phosphoribosylanthranilate isomerase [Gammaproteobacteria bacterium]|nr:phosphoribosylanthranilate isomerase [Gammaproteobacteria bacterium]
MNESRRTRIKICGMTREEDVRIAGYLGADAIGLVFYAPSPRNLTLETAWMLVRSAPPFLTTVGLFLDAGKAAVDKVLEAVPLDLLQFHGAESPEFCSSFGRPYIKAVPMRDAVDFDEYTGRYRDASGFLLDSHASGAAGGSGETFDWSSWPRRSSQVLILAGGLSPDNVAAAIHETVPWGVDVSSGVESGKGMKDPEKMAAFCREVQRIDAQRD